MRDIGKFLCFVVCTLEFLAFGTMQSMADGTFPGLLQPGQVLGNKGTTAGPAGAMYPLPQNAQSSNYTAVTSDCGKRIVFNVTAQVTLTLGAGSGYPANCDITVSNIGYYNGPGTARGVILSVSGVVMPNQGNVLYPNQTTVFSNSGVSSAWVESGYTQRALWKPPTPVTFYVDCQNGSDSAADGLGTGAGANKTLGQGFQRVSDFVDYSGGENQLTFSTTGTCGTTLLGDGIHMAGILRGGQGGSAFTWNGNGTTTVNSAGGTNCASLFNGAWIQIVNVNCQSADGSGCFSVSWSSRIFFAAPASTCNPGTGIGYQANDPGSKIEFQGGGLNFGSPSGLASVNGLFYAQNYATIGFDSAQTITFLGNVTFSGYDITVYQSGIVSLLGTTFDTSTHSATVTGIRFLCAGYSLLLAGASPNTTIPGSSNGALGTDCQSNGSNTPIPNSALANSSITLAGQNVPLGSSGGLATANNTLASNVSLSNTSNYFDGPSMTQGTTGTWWISGNVQLDSSSSDVFRCKLWDGTTVISAFEDFNFAGDGGINRTLSGFLASPAGNIRISCRDISSTNGLIEANESANHADSTIWGIRIN
jgi:hypothetical protein